MTDSKNTNKKSSKEKILKKLHPDPMCLAIWTTKSGMIYYVVLDKAKQTHSVYLKTEEGYKMLFATKDYYSIQERLKKYED